jgi:hypothetical protein
MKGERAFPDEGGGSGDPARKLPSGESDQESVERNPVSRKHLRSYP